MIKRIMPIILCLILVFSISVLATNTTEDTTAENNQTTEEIPQRQGRLQGGGRGNMGTPSEMPSEEIPPDLPEGMTPPEMPSRDNSIEGNVPHQMKEQVPPNMTEQEQSADKTSENNILTFAKTYSTPIISIVLLLLAFVFVIFYKRKSY